MDSKTAYIIFLCAVIAILAAAHSLHDRHLRQQLADQKLDSVVFCVGGTTYHDGKFEPIVSEERMKEQFDQCEQLVYAYYTME